MSSLQPGDQVLHAALGQGRVEFDKGETVIVRFPPGIEEVDRSALQLLQTPLQAVRTGAWSPLRETVAKAQAEAIRSVHDAWGVFALSRIALLPHQLWVCRRVVSQWPTHWLIADDVGLGKTIEGGLILSALMSRGVARRVLIVCPASLVFQWQVRLRTMFDLRFATYSAEADRPNSDFWNTQNQVIASLQTLRLDRQDRQARLLESEPWDLLIVDEAHHLNTDEKSGPTLGHQLVVALRKNKRVTSVVFFTGTPHRGKDYGFLSLLSLLDARFDPQRPLRGQLDRLPGVMIRNNKQAVTDLAGKPLFHPPNVTSETYAYTPPEEAFYRMLTEFITSGKAYATSLSVADGKVVVLVLITMQKLASSSVAAIRRALKGRLERLVVGEKRVVELQNLLSQYRRYELDAEADVLSGLEEELVSVSAEVRLMRDERPRLEELVRAADKIGIDTKFEKILDVLQTRYPDRSVLFFTEYKATQSQLMSVLMRVYGDEAVTFINGDDRADEVVNRQGRRLSLSMPRGKAIDKFLTGQARFMVSTEAGGEGIDLQARCHTLIHVDLPWNPMRLHQRVGRLNRYGQTQVVDVLTIRNADTVEAAIWDCLNEKIAHIKLALNQVMDEPEDLLQLVLGMTSPSLFTELFADAADIPRERLQDWFDQRTAQFGGRDAVHTVLDLVGNATHFDFQNMASQLPRVDLPALQPFFASMLAHNGRRLREDAAGLSFRTPERWLTDVGVRPNYANMVFDRSVSGPDAPQRVLGVGQRAFDQALTQALGFSAPLAAIPTEVFGQPLFMFRIYDRVTGGSNRAGSVVVAVQSDPEQPTGGQVLRDWQLLLELNRSVQDSRPELTQSLGSLISTDVITSAAKSAEQRLQLEIQSLDLPFQRPAVDLVSILWPV